jgi:hypothetical protein
MSTQGDSIHTSKEIVSFYTDHLKNFGDTPKGVGWKNDLAQEVRFEQLIKIINQKINNFTINDLGCGTGKLYSFLSAKNFQPTYYGYDILEEMIEAAKTYLPIHTSINLIKINSATEMQPADYSVSSGIFNVKYGSKESEWLHNVLSTIEAMYEKSKLGFAFNMLTKYSDKEYMQPYLYYADPLFFFDYCKRNFSKNVSLLHDYDQYDFTILVRI